MHLPLWSTATLKHVVTRMVCMQTVWYARDQGWYNHPLLSWQARVSVDGSVNARRHSERKYATEHANAESKGNILRDC